MSILKWYKLWQCFSFFLLCFLKTSTKPEFCHCDIPEGYQSAGVPLPAAGTGSLHDLESTSWVILKTSFLNPAMFLSKCMFFRIRITVFRESGSPCPFKSFSVQLEMEHLGHGPCKMSYVSEKAFTYPKVVVVRESVLDSRNTFVPFSISCWSLSFTTHQTPSGLFLLLPLF